jgi:hypothetical protein
MKGLLCVALLVGSGGVLAQAPTAVAPCPAIAEIARQQMVGLWRAEFDGLWQGATLLMEKHPEYEGSISGAINRNGKRGQLAGDIENGEFTMEESDDGVRISGTFVGDIVEGSCGREIRGTWTPETTDPPRPFVLRKQD